MTEENLYITKKQVIRQFYYLIGALLSGFAAHMTIKLSLLITEENIFSFSSFLYSFMTVLYGLICIALVGYIIMEFIE